MRPAKPESAWVSDLVAYRRKISPSVPFDATQGKRLLDVEIEKYLAVRLASALGGISNHILNRGAVIADDSFLERLTGAAALIMDWMELVGLQRRDHENRLLIHNAKWRLQGAIQHLPEGSGRAEAEAALASIQRCEEALRTQLAVRMLD